MVKFSVSKNPRWWLVATLDMLKWPLLHIWLADRRDFCQFSGSKAGFFIYSQSNDETFSFRKCKMAAGGHLRHTKIVITSQLVCRSMQCFSNKYDTNRDNKTANIYIKKLPFLVLL